MKHVVITKSGPPEVLQIRDAPDPIPHAGVWRLDVDKIAQKFPIDGEQWATGIRDIDCLDWSPADAAQIANARRRSADILTAAIARHLAGGFKRSTQRFRRV